MPDDKHPVADQFSDDEMHGIKAMGEALGGKPTPFDEEVEAHLAGYEAQRNKKRTGEASAEKMQAARTGGADLAPPQADIRAAQQQQALAQEATAQSALGATQAQGAQAALAGPPTVPPPPPPKQKGPPPPAPGPQQQSPEEPEEET